MNISLSQKDLIFIAKVLDQRRLSLKYNFKSSLSKDHVALKNKILNGINSKLTKFTLDAPKRELIYLSHALIQYFIASIRAEIFHKEKEYIHILKQLSEVIDEDFDETISKLFE